MPATVPVSALGPLWVVHPDDPPAAEIRRRLRLLLAAPLPSAGVIEARPGDTPDEVRWRVLTRCANHRQCR